ncbi:hypothetical protein NMY22_g9190 [Coprinellus aureogranulatus]|nr:hypothetical protein NMY22_g9190 [Coprinellus aureogranulatus]
MQFSVSRFVSVLLVAVVSISSVAAAPVPAPVAVAENTDVEARRCQQMRMCLYSLRPCSSHCHQSLPAYQFRWVLVRTLLDSENLSVAALKPVRGYSGQSQGPVWFFVRQSLALGTSVCTADRVLNPICSPHHSRGIAEAFKVQEPRRSALADSHRPLPPPLPPTQSHGPAQRNLKVAQLLRATSSKRAHHRPLGRVLPNGRKESAAYSSSYTSTQGSGSRKSISPSRASFSSIPPPPLPEKYVEGEVIPRVSLSTEDGHSVDVQPDETASYSTSKAPQLLPPIPTGDFSDSVQELTGGRAQSNASNRLSYLSELRSKRDRSDTASMMTVDEITAEVESRRISQVPDMSNPDLDDWTKVENEEETLKDTDVDGSTLNQADDDAAEVDDLDDEEEEDEDFDIEIPSRTAANKWIKGALIGQGSFGKVYLGMDANSGLLMAVKQVELPQGTGPNQERKKSMLSALETEIELLKVLQHENIVQYLYSSIEDEHLNIFLEYVPGGSVATLLSNYGAFEETLVRNFVRQILQGLNYLHERDIIHRDIKGANILVDNKGGVKISDFGISKKVDDNLLGGNRLHRPSLQGSVFWMAPEVVKQTKHTKKADIWSVGCLIVEMLTGEHPWAQLTQMQAIFKIGSSAKPAIPSDVSPEAQDFLERTFEINHEARPPANELLQHPWIAVKRSKKGSAKERREKEVNNASPGPETA